jgi:hypothetical protein
LNSTEQLSSCFLKKILGWMMIDDINQYILCLINQTLSKLVEHLILSNVLTTIVEIKKVGFATGHM